MATEHPVGGSPPAVGSTVSGPPSIRRAVALPLNDGDIGSGEASALVSATQTARAASAVTSAAQVSEGTLGSVTGGRTNRAGTAGATAVSVAAATTRGADGATQAGRLFRPRFRPQQGGAGSDGPTTATLTAVPPANEGDENEAVVNGALAEGSTRRRPGRTATGHGHSPKLGRWPMVAAAVAGAALLSAPFVHNSGSKNVTGLESTGNATADGYASDMPTYEPNDGPASPLVPEAESDTPPVASGNGRNFVAANGDTVTDDGTDTVPGTPVKQPTPASGELPTDVKDQPGQDDEDLPAGVKNGVPFSLGIAAGSPSSDLPGGPLADSSSDGSDSDYAPLQPRVGTTLTDQTDAVEPTVDKPDSTKTDTVKPAVVKTNTVKSDSTKSGSTKPNTVKSNSIKSDTVKSDPVKSHTVKPTVAKPTPAKPAKPAKPATPDWSTKVVSTTTVLDSGDSVASNRMRITLGSNGNLVISDENGVVRWSSGTSGSGNRAVFQADGNLVVYSSDGKTLWSSGTGGNDGAKLVIQADGNVAILTAGDSTLWAAGTQH